ncbi:MAG: lamin tail domain-containing protein [Candidatus Fermentibacteraceae bacterium]|nr:lamin tail domain-containing protein [Candidatus Fermentibacteraceae bacterium]MBN2608346.1 lamin tail domain-containing protein [Candidatus Fermentibacteraceae bacterium]
MMLLAVLILTALPGDLVISEIMYNPDGTTMGPDELLEWVELYNAGDETVDLDGMILSDSSNQLVLDDYLIQPGEYVVVAASSGAFMDLYGPDIPIVEWNGDWTKLRNSGDQISLSTSDGTIIESVIFSDGWGRDNGSGSPADGDGSTLERIDLLGGTEESNWAPSEDWDHRIVTAGNPLCWGTPGARNSRWR